MKQLFPSAFSSLYRRRYHRAIPNDVAPILDATE